MPLYKDPTPPKKVSTVNFFGCMLDNQKYLHHYICIFYFPYLS